MPTLFLSNRAKPASHDLIESLISVEYFPEGKMLPGFYPHYVSNDLDFHQVIDALALMELEQSPGHPRVAILFEESNFISLLPTLKRFADIVILADVDPTQLKHAQCLLDAFQRASTPAEFLSMYRSIGQEECRNPADPYYPLKEVIYELYDTVFSNPASDNAESLKAHYFLSSEAQYTACKQALEDLSLLTLNFNITNTVQVEAFAELMRQSNAQLSFCNITNLHDYNDAGKMLTVMKTLLANAPECIVMYATKEPELRFRTRFSIGLRGYYTDVLAATTKLLHQHVVFSDNGVFTVRLRDNANIVSNEYLDVISPIEIENIKKSGMALKVEAGIVPLSCSTADKYSTTQAQGIIDSWNAPDSKAFYEEQTRILNERREQYEDFFADLEKQSWDEFNKITKDFEPSEKIKLKTIFLRVMRYRENIEKALYAKELQYLNCGEQSACAFVDELILIKNGEYSDIPNKVHLIHLYSAVDDHAFIVLGSTTLQEQISNDVNSISDILENMDGTIIDYWNNPQSGGVRLPAKIAREKFVMYSQDVVGTLDRISVEEYLTEDIHVQIQKMDLPDLIKQFLHKYAGPSLSEIEERIICLDEKYYPKQKIPPPSKIPEKKLCFIGGLSTQSVALQLIKNNIEPAKLIRPLRKLSCY